MAKKRHSKIIQRKGDNNCPEQMSQHNNNAMPMKNRQGQQTKSTAVATVTERNDEQKVHNYVMMRNLPI